MNAEPAMKSGAERTIFCVLSNEQRAEFETGLGREIPAGTHIEFESDPDDALDRAGELRPRLVIVGMTIEPMEGLEFLAMLMARYQDFYERVIVLPEVGDPFPPMLQYRDRQSGRSVTEELEYDEIPALIRSITTPELESKQAPKPVTRPLAGAARPEPQAVKPAAQPGVAQRPDPVPPREAPRVSVAQREQAASTTSATSATPSFKAAEPPSGVQKVAEQVSLKPSPVKSINPSPALADLVMAPVPGTSAPQNSDPIALADTLLGRPPAVHTPLDAPSLPVPPAASAGMKPPPAQAPLAAPEAPASGPSALQPAAPAPAPVPAPAAVPEAAPAMQPPVAAAPPQAPFPDPAALPAPHAPTGSGVTLPGRRPPLAVKSATPASLLDKLAVGPLKNLPPHKRWIAWAALATPLVLLVLLLALLLLSSGSSADSSSGQGDQPAQKSGSAAVAATPKAATRRARAEAPAKPAAPKATTTEAPPAETAAPEAPAATDLGELVTMPLSFERGEYEFSVSDQGKLDELLTLIFATLKAKPDMRLEVGGHTSEEGNQRFNKALGKQRADMVLAYLIKKGVPVERAIIKNYQATVPSASADADAQRRVTIRVVR